MVTRCSRRWLFMVLACALSSGAWAAPVAVREKPDLEYGRAAKEKLLLDLYLPAPVEGQTPAPRPLVVMFHGGAWRGGSRKDYVVAARDLVQRGFVVASVDYRLAPAYRFPAQLDDVQLAIRWLRGHASEYGIDPKRVASMGGSAGGHLAALVGVRDTRATKGIAYPKESSRVECVVDWFGPTDFLHLDATQTIPEALTWVKDFLGPRSGATEANYREASPVAFVSKESAPTLIVQGTQDPLVAAKQSELLADALRLAGAEVRLVIIEGGNHGFSEPAHFRRAWDESVKWLVSHLKP